MKTLIFFASTVLLASPLFAVQPTNMNSAAQVMIQEFLKQEAAVLILKPSGAMG